MIDGGIFGGIFKINLIDNQYISMDYLMNVVPDAAITLICGADVKCK